MPVRFTVGHLGAGAENLDVSLKGATEALDSLLRELHAADDEHYQVYVINSTGASITAFDGGLMVLQRTASADAYYRPATQAEAVGVLMAFVRLKDDVFHPEFSLTKPAPGVNFVLAEMGEFALHKAAHSGNLTRVKDLVEVGAEVNRPDKYGATPLLLAAIEGHEDVCRFLLEHGADPNVRDPEDGSGLLRVARRYPALVELFKHEGATE